MAALPERGETDKKSFIIPFSLQVRGAGTLPFMTKQEEAEASPLINSRF
jgi:hypothetical protein